MWNTYRKELGSSVSTITSLPTGQLGNRSSILIRGYNYFVHNSVQTGNGPNQPLIRCKPEAVSLGTLRLGLETEHSPPSSVDVTNAWSYASTLSKFIPWCLLKHGHNFDFAHIKQDLRQTNNSRIFPSRNYAMIEGACCSGILTDISAKGREGA